MPSAAALVVAAVGVAFFTQHAAASSATAAAAAAAATAAAAKGGGGSRRGRTQLVSVSAPWPTSRLSPLAEASEFVAEGGRDLFWDFVEALGDAPQSMFLLSAPHACDDGGSACDDAAATEGGCSCGGDGGGGGSRQGDPEDVAAPSVAAGIPQDAVHGEDAAGSVVAAAVTAAGRGFGQVPDDSSAGSSGVGGGGGGGGGVAPGVGLDALSLRLLEVALSARCV